MGIFSKNDKQSKPQSGTTILREGTFIRGGVDTAGDVYCDGKFEGMISAKSLTIGKTGEVIGNINVQHLIVSGLVDGIINSDDVNILESGSVLGKMQYQNLAIDKNGIFEGEGKMKNSTLVSKYKSITNESQASENNQVQELIEEV